MPSLQSLIKKGKTNKANLTKGKSIKVLQEKKWVKIVFSELTKIKYKFDNTYAFIS